jgi:hypothetical protein
MQAGHGCALPCLYLMHPAYAAEPGHAWVPMLCYLCTRAQRIIIGHSVAVLLLTVGARASVQVMLGVAKGLGRREMAMLFPSQYNRSTHVNTHALTAYMCQPLTKGRCWTAVQEPQALSGHRTHPQLQYTVCIAGSNDHEHALRIDSQRPTSWLSHSILVPL